MFNREPEKLTDGQLAAATSRPHRRWISRIIFWIGLAAVIICIARMRFGFTFFVDDANQMGLPFPGEWGLILILLAAYLRWSAKQRRSNDPSPDAAP